MNDETNENLILKKRLKTCRSAKGTLSRIPNDLVIDVVRAWERWPGTAKSFYQSLGIKKQQLGTIIKKGKKLFLESGEQLGPFTPVEVQPASPEKDKKIPIILNWDKKNIIKFYQVSHLVEFLKQAS